MYCFLHSGVMCAERCSANFILPSPPHSHSGPAVTGGGGNSDSDSSPHGSEGGLEAGALKLETAGGRGAGRGAGRAGRASRPGRRAGEARRPRGSGASRAGLGVECPERNEAAAEEGWMATGAPGSRVGLVVSGPHGPLTQPRGPLRATLRSRRPCTSRSLASEVGSVM